MLHLGSGFVRRTPREHPLILTLVAVVLALLPLSFGSPLWPNDIAAKEFLSVMWQVIAGTLGIVVAAVLFLFEAYASTIRGRYGISVTHYSSRAGVTSLIGWLIASLTLTGAVLLGWGNGAPRGWAGFMAVAVAFGTLLNIPRAFRAVATLISKDQVQNLRGQAIRRNVAESLRRELHLSRMASELNCWVASRGAVLQPLLVSSNAPLVTSSETGRVVDVNLRRLARTLKDLPSDSELTVAIPLTFRVKRGDPVIGMPGANSAQNTVEDFLVTIPVKRRKRPGSEDTYLSELNADVLRTIREQDEEELDDHLEMYEHVVATVMEYESGLATAGLPANAIDADLLLRIRRDAYQQFREALRAGNDSMVQTLGRVPLTMVQTALDAGRTQSAGDFLRLAGLMARAELETS